ncbi:putative bifunctional diguanylate cyclase/phosphodiesterase [Sphaerotilus uruguayifluvii]|uniref:Diguanylate cyclase (GGDEF)-like protein n=1 Tax=Sphaerotilus uruguayifluvii TaxID=2735897 RepID=A0ABX2G3U1_9BURK|nr:EAL domain-containing protein [Leptothrix sp. C29]NRT56123.1 diguanylate cyclase (GGDEF)-like protein [Leptothrix sp. C29]
MSPATTLVPGSGARVLIVDDEGLTRMMIRRVLEDYGYRVIEAQDGQTAVRLCDAEQPELVLMDVRMPVMNGFDACRAIRRSLRSSHTPVLMLTALDDVMAVTLAFEAGATDFVTKPINWALLSQRVRYALRTAHTERELRESQIALARAQKIARLAPWRLELDDGRLHCSRELRELLALPGGEPQGARRLLREVASEDRPRLLDFVRRVRQGRRESEVEIRLGGTLHPSRYLFLSGDAMLDETGRPTAIFGVAQDVSERRQAEARLSYHAHFDELTGLPNRVLFRDRVATAAAAAQQSQQRFAVLNIDVDVLQRTQASVAQAASDRILRAVALRLESVMRERDSLCRLEGDTFAMLITDIDAEAQIAGATRRLIDAFAVPLPVDDWELLASVHVGVAIWPGDGQDVDTLLQHSGAARSRAREATGSSCHFYTADMHNRVIDRLNTEVALYRGLERGEFELHYQPKVDLRSGRVTGVEALLRWNRPGFGLQMPDRFIDILEQTGLIMDAGDWVVREACAAIRNLPLSLAVNVSPRQFQHPRLGERLMRILDESGFPAERLELEVTEQIVVEDEQGAIATLHDLAGRGIRIALDDYGTGFSSLQRLKKLPLHTLKIDKDFVMSLETSRADAAIVRSTIELCHQLDIDVVAEGVENEAAMTLLRSFDCDIGQGYGICRPQPLGRLVEWLASATIASAAAGSAVQPG